MSATNLTYNEMISLLHQYRDVLIDLHQRLDTVPNAQKTKHSEMMQALNYITYRLLNDGDSMYVGYGCETCGREAAWLMNEYPEQFKAPIMDGLKKFLESDDIAYLNLLHDLIQESFLIIEYEQDEPLEKKINDYEQEWETEKCDSCECVFETSELESDGMGGQFCHHCYDNSDE